MANKGATNVRGVRCGVAVGAQAKVTATRAACLCGALSLLIASGVNAGPVVVFDNYGPNDTSAAFDGQIINPIVPNVNRDYANAFVPSASGFVSDLWVSINMYSGINALDLWLMEDDGGLPGTTLDSWSVSGAMGLVGGFAGPIHVTADETTLIEEGRTYWLAASTPDPTVANWAYNVIGDTGPVVARREDLGAWELRGELRGAMRVGVTPEPASLGMVLLGGWAALRRRRSSARPA